MSSFAHFAPLRLCVKNKFPSAQAAKRMAQSVNFICVPVFMMFSTHKRENGMFRAISALLFIVFILPFAAFIASVTMKAAGVSGLLGYIIGFPVFIGILTVSVMILAAINDHIYNSERDRKARNRTFTKSAH